MSSSTPTFPHPAHRNLLAPVLIAFLVLGIVIALVLRYTPSKTADLSIIRTAIFPAHTVFKSDSLVVNSDRTQDDLYVLTTLHIDDRLHLPLFLKDFTATLTTADGEEITTSAVEKNDLPNLFTTFPALKALASEPLLRDSVVGPGQSAEGMIVLHFPVTESVWDNRRSAILKVDLYHQGIHTIAIDRKSEVTPPTYTPPPSKSHPEPEEQ
jgi:hypothetical protein